MIKILLPHLAAVTVFFAVHYAIYCYGTCTGERDRRFIYIAGMLCFPSIILMLVTLEPFRDML